MSGMHKILTLNCRAGGSLETQAFNDIRWVMLAKSGVVVSKLNSLP